MDGDGSVNYEEFVNMIFRGVSEEDKNLIGYIGRPSVRYHYLHDLAY